MSVELVGEADLPNVILLEREVGPLLGYNTTLAQAAMRQWPSEMGTYDEYVIKTCSWDTPFANVRGRLVYKKKEGICVMS